MLFSCEYVCRQYQLKILVNITSMVPFPLDFLIHHIDIFNKNCLALLMNTLFYFAGFLINFISAPVISAFTSAVSIQVATSQVKGLLGLDVSPSHEYIYSNDISHENLIREIGGSCRRTILFGGKGI